MAGTPSVAGAGKPSAEVSKRSGSMVPRTKNEPARAPRGIAPDAGSKPPVVTPSKPSSKPTTISRTPNIVSPLGRAVPPNPAAARSIASRLRAGTIGTASPSSDAGSAVSSTALTAA